MVYHAQNQKMAEIYPDIKLVTVDAICSTIGTVIGNLSSFCFCRRTFYYRGHISIGIGEKVIPMISWVGKLHATIRLRVSCIKVNVSL